MAGRDCGACGMTIGIGMGGPTFNGADMVKFSQLILTRKKNNHSTAQQAQRYLFGYDYLK